MRGIGLIVVLYAFSHSYFGVGSLKNAWGSAPTEAVFRTFAFLYGLSWIALFAGGTALLLHHRRGLHLAQGAAGVSAFLQLAGIVMRGNMLGLNMNTDIFNLAHPVYGLFLVAMLPRFSPVSRPLPCLSKGSSLTILIAAALLPWIALLASRLISGGPPILSPPVSAFLMIFMSIWSVLPMGVLILTIKVWPAHSPSAAAFAGGLAGTVVASLYCYGLVWVQNGNSFLLALMPPVVFAGQALGICAGMLCEKRG